MNMQHECLVQFLGAGVMTEPEYGLRVLFTVQVFALDAILFFASASFQFCTGVHVRWLIGSKDLEPAYMQCDMGRETPCGARIQPRYGSFNQCEALIGDCREWRLFTV